MQAIGKVGVCTVTQNPRSCGILSILDAVKLEDPCSRVLCICDIRNCLVFVHAFSRISRLIYVSLAPVNRSHPCKAINTNYESGYDSYDKECEDCSVKENILISHLDRVEEDAGTHVMPLNTEELGGILIELGVVP